MTRLINIDNGGTLTDFCLVDGDEVRYTKTLTTPYDLSRCLFDGLAKVSELAYGEPRLAALLQSTDCIRYSTTQGTNALVQRAGPQLGLLVTDPTLIEGLAATQAQEDLLAALVGDRWGRISLDADDEALGRELLTRVNDLSARGARRLVVAVSGADGPRTRPGSRVCCCGSAPVTCWVRSRCCSPGSSSPTPTTYAGPGRACSRVPASPR